jgi:flagellar protein FliS
MLYDGAIAALNRAIAAIEAHDIEKKCHHLNRALAIILQLEGSLNFELGGEVAQTLKSFYAYARAQAIKANIENSTDILRALIENLTTVRDAWQEGERRLATQGAGRNANNTGARRDWGEAATVELSVSD